MLYMYTLQNAGKQDRLHEKQSDSAVHEQEADAYLIKVLLAHEGGEEGVRVTDAIRRDGRYISAEAIPPVVS